MPKVGLEPTHPHGYQILSLARLPFRHFGFPIRIKLKQHLSKFPNLISNKTTDNVPSQSNSSAETNDKVKPIFVVMQQWSDNFQQSEG